MPKKTTTQTITVRVDKENAPDLEILAQDICAVANAFKKIEGSRLHRRVILLLLRDMCPSVSLGDIHRILDAAPKLQETYIKKAKT